MRDLRQNNILEPAQTETVAKALFNGTLYTGFPAPLETPKHSHTKRHKTRHYHCKTHRGPPPLKQRELSFCTWPSPTSSGQYRVSTK